MKKGYQYPEGGSGIEVNIDICPECFENKIILKSSVPSSKEFRERYSEIPNYLFLAFLSISHFFIN